MADAMVTIAQAALALGVSKRTLRLMERRGEVRPLYAQRGSLRWRYYDRTEIERLRCLRQPRRAKAARR
jgi:DNA-binding transcriptional MerR regulator